MLRNKIKGSLTVRIFLITCLILLAACAVTYGIIALATPITYTSIVTSHFEQQAADLPAQLEQTTLEECGPVIDRFILDTGANVMIVDEDGVILNTPSNLSISVTFADESTAVVDSAVVYSDENNDIFQQVTIKSDSDLTDDDWKTVSVTTDSLSYPFSFQGDTKVNFAYISPPVEKANQTLQALGQVAPWLLAVMLLFSVLCALFYSRYITRPIVKLSEISQRMAGMDFSWKCGENRPDEIGVLGRNLNELSQHLSTALTELKDANAALRQDIDRERELERQRLAFFSAASHELKTPVTILKGQLTGMLEGIDVYQDRDKYLAKSLQVASRMESLVQEILTVSRMEADGFALHVRQVDLAELVCRQLAFYEDLVFQKELRVETNLPTSALLAADPVLLQKVLDNLLSNAVFYAPDGAKLSIAISAGDSGPVLAVENSGSHIQEDALPHVFEAFYRADASRNRRTGGSGLGLYIVKMILDRHGAEYRVENTADGVRFTICFS